ncbi:MAG: hypothetical protein GSR80_000148 [Desulfurococcales archaeon]|nr:hypothetical protein [Desulfurococcales archaeon]
MRGKRQASQRSGSVDVHSIIDRINVRLEMIEKLIAREASKGCDCISSGWLYAILENIEDIHDSLSSLKYEIESRC